MANNPSAFPRPASDAHSHGMHSAQEGMTLRDYFAAKAMQGDIAAMVDPMGERCGIQIDLPDDNLIQLGKMYYRMADAMLKARQA
jgi:hypothetical protein